MKTMVIESSKIKGKKKKKIQWITGKKGGIDVLKHSMNPKRDKKQNINGCFPNFPDFCTSHKPFFFFIVLHVKLKRW